MTREEMNFIGGMNMCDEISNEAYKKIMCHCEELEPCDDCISRQAVHDLIATWLSDYLLDDTREVLEVIDEKVEDLPSVTPKAGSEG